MGILRPATPGFLITLAAAACLAVVVFCVPYFKSVYFLKASFSQDGQTGWITLGTLGYCFNAGSNTTCSKPSVGYEFDPNKLLGNTLPVDIPEIAVKWLTYALVLHVVALGLAAVSAVFGLLAHVREMSMACCSTCFSGAAAAITLTAFVFDLAFFFAAKSRINKVQGGSATIGNAIWLTLASWLMLFFAGCFFSFGRCCIGTRGGGGSRRKNRKDDTEAEAVKPMPGGYSDNSYADSMRLQAVKAEADRKARAANTPKEQGLPAFEEYTPLNPSRHEYADPDELYADHPGSHNPGGAGFGAAAGLGAAALATGARREGSGYSGGQPGNLGRQPTSSSTGGGAAYPGGYSGGAPGTRAVDNYYNNASSSPAAGGYPPQAASGYPPAPHATSPPNVGGYAVGAVYGAAPARQASYDQQATRYPDPYGQPQPQSAYADPYGAPAAHHQQEPSYDPYAGHPSNYAATPGAGAAYYDQTISGAPTGQTYYTANDVTPHQPGASQYPANERNNSSYFSPSQSPPQPLSSPYAAPVTSSSPTVAAAHYGARAMPVPSTSPIRGPSETNAPQDWNTHARMASSSSDHPGTHEETLPEYNPYEEQPASSSILASGGPTRTEKR